MNVVIVFDHPYGASASENIPHRRSFSAALLAAVTRGLLAGGHTVDLIDLQADGFNPVTTAEDLAAWRQKMTRDPVAAGYQKRLMKADHLIFIFPIWWETMPALTKGFLDKVFVKGIVFDEVKPGRPFLCQLPRLKGVTLLTVMSTPGFVYRWILGNPVTKILFRGTFRKMGIHNLRWFNFSGMENLSLEKRRHRLDLTEERFSRI